MKPTQIVVYNYMLRPFLVKLVQKGERYGLRDSLTHDKDDPMVIFFDLSQDLTKFGPEGQQVSSYYRSTLLERERGVGLTLVGHVREWVVDGQAMNQVYRWLEAPR